MKHSIGSNQYQAKGRFTMLEKILLVILINGLAGIYLHNTQKQVVSPVPNVIQQVSAQESQAIVDRWNAREELKKIKSEQEKPTTENIIAYIAKKWAKEGTEKMFQAIHIAKSESGLRINAKNWNCYYEVGGKTISTSCKPEDRQNAWSVDCGIFQHNIAGTECPTMSWKENVDKAFSLYVRRGFQPWVAAWSLGY